MSTLTGKLQGKVAIVTGASKGIGASIAKHLAGAGAAVVVAGHGPDLTADQRHAAERRLHLVAQQRAE